VITGSQSGPGSSRPESAETGPSRIRQLGSGEGSYIEHNNDKASLAQHESAVRSKITDKNSINLAIN
jgi:hypothetical protein